jgi:hypothetical protein
VKDDLTRAMDALAAARKATRRATEDLAVVLTASAAAGTSERTLARRLGVTQPRIHQLIVAGRKLLERTSPSSP